MNAATPKVSAAERWAIMETRATQPRMTAEEIQAVATKHGISPSYVKALRRQYADENDLPLMTGRQRKLLKRQELRLVRLIWLRNHLSNKHLARLFGISESLVSTTFYRLVSRYNFRIPRYLGAAKNAR